MALPEVRVLVTIHTTPNRALAVTFSDKLHRSATHRGVLVNNNKI